MTTTDLALFSEGADDLDERSDEHYERLLTGGQGIVVLCDVSPSMNSPAVGCVKGDRHLSRYEALSEALAPFRDQARVVAFSGDVTELRRHDKLPDPSRGNGTDIAKAIRHATTMNPARTILISDGEPNSDWDAFEAAKKLPGILETIFVGNDHDHAAKKFMLDIATKCGGEFQDLAGESGDDLAPTLARLMLPP